MFLEGNHVADGRGGEGEGVLMPRVEQETIEARREAGGVTMYGDVDIRKLFTLLRDLRIPCNVR